MKATLATLACLLTVGFLSAASVSGNNTAVVIKKNVVKSQNGYQFLCVPVDGLDIANGTTEVKLSTFLPPTLLDENTTISYTTGEGTTASYTVAVVSGEQIWAVPNGNNAFGAPQEEITLPGGTPFWLYSPSSDSTNAASLFAAFGLAVTVANDEPETIIFCGQQRNRDVLESLGQGVTALKNDSSSAITLNQAVNMTGFTPRAGDQIMTIQAGTSEYKRYTYNGQNWRGTKAGSSWMDNITEAVIAPGEAFYYYNSGSDVTTPNP